MFKLINKNNERDSTGVRIKSTITGDINNRDLEGCIISAVCQDTKHTSCIYSQIHTHTYAAMRTSNLKFPQTKSLIRGHKSIASQTPANKEAYHQQKQFLPSDLLIKMHCFSLLLFPPPDTTVS